MWRPWRSNVSDVPEHRASRSLAPRAVLLRRRGGWDVLARAGTWRRACLPQWWRAQGSRPTLLHTCLMVRCHRTPVACYCTLKGIGLAAGKARQRREVWLHGPGAMAVLEPPKPATAATRGGGYAASSPLATVLRGQTVIDWSCGRSRRTRLEAGRMAPVLGLRRIIRCKPAAVQAHGDLLTTSSWIVLRAVVIAMSKHSLMLRMCMLPFSGRVVINAVPMDSLGGRFGAVGLQMAPVAPAGVAPRTEGLSSRLGA